MKICHPEWFRLSIFVPQTHRPSAHPVHVPKPSGRLSDSLPRTRAHAWQDVPVLPVVTDAWRICNPVISNSPSLAAISISITEKLHTHTHTHLHTRTYTICSSRCKNGRSRHISWQMDKHIANKTNMNTFSSDIGLLQISLHRCFVTLSRKRLVFVTDKNQVFSPHCSAFRYLIVDISKAKYSIRNSWENDRRQQPTRC